MSTTLIPTADWQASVTELQQLLAELRPQLISAETELADRMAAINRFEFHLRSRIGHLTREMDSLTAEIADLRVLIRRRREEWLERNGYDAIVGEWGELWEVVDEAEGAEAADSYRYRDPAQRHEPKEVTADDAAALKKLYRQLARRFHPDLAEQEEDRQHRTQLMMAINAAYAAADLPRLEQLALEPDTVSGTIHYDSLKQQAQALLKELTRLQQRLKEIQTEIRHLEHHRSSRLRRKVQKAESEGRDLIAEIAEDLRDKITQMVIERDVLQQELAGLDDPDGPEMAFVSEALADAIWDMTLDNAYQPDDGADEVDEWLFRKRGRKIAWDEDENDLESYS